MGNRNRERGLASAKALRQEGHNVFKDLGGSQWGWSRQQEASWYPMKLET